MKRTLASMLIVAVLSFWIPCASAEISQDLDPMVSPESQATVTGESSLDSMEAGQTSNIVSTVDATTAGTKIGDAEKEKSKKSSKKKSSEKKKKKSNEKKQKKTSAKSAKKHKKSSMPVTESTTSLY